MVSARDARREGFAFVIAIALGLVSSVGITAQEPGVDVRRDATVRVLEDVTPSVVNISTETVIEIQDPFDQLLRDFFGYGRRAPNAEKSLGSGVVIDETGYVLTNFHVVRRATRITVTTWDGRKYEATRVTDTARSDVALLKLMTKPGETFRAVKFAPDDDLLLGETVLALGNPFGLGNSVSRGILSSKSRRPPIKDEPLEIEDWLQTDAAINPGNSGGPLINLRGELIGINVAIFREGQGIGFAIPVKRISEALSEIFTPEVVQGLWFGARFRSGSNGLVTTVVEGGSPAERGGLRKGDRVLRVNNQPVKSAIELNREVMGRDESRTVQMQVQRGRERKNLAIELVPEAEVFNAGLIRKKIGALVEELSPELASRFGVNPGNGLLVAGVDRSGPAADAELRRGFVIQSLDGQVPQGIVSAARLLARKKPGDKVTLGLIVPQARGGFVRLFPATAELIVR